MTLTLRENAVVCFAPVTLMFLMGHYVTGLLSAALGAYLLYLDATKMELKDKVTGEPYLTRWKLVRCRWFRVFVHRIYQADQDRDLHNHPWPFAASFILRGGYDELRTHLPDWDDCPGCENYHTHNAPAVSRLYLQTYHRITHVEPNTWTLFVAGPRSRRWGFLVDGKHVDATTYLGLPWDYDWKD